MKQDLFIFENLMDCSKLIINSYLRTKSPPLPAADNTSQPAGPLHNYSGSWHRDWEENPLQKMLTTSRKSIKSRPAKPFLLGAAPDIKIAGKKGKTITGDGWLLKILGVDD